MTEVTGGYRQIVRASSLVAGGSVLSTVIGIAKTKAFALILGPAGVGVLGLLSSLMATGTMLFGLGFSHVGTRQIAEANARGNEGDVAAARQALVGGTILLSLLGSLTVALLQNPIARWVLGDASLSAQVGWLSIGVGLGIAAGSQSAVLNGFRRIADLVWVGVAGAMVSAVIGVGAIWLFGQRGVLVFILALPASTLVFGYLYVRRLPSTWGVPRDVAAILVQWQALVKLGAAFTLAGIVTTGSQLFVRAAVERQLGIEAVGFFQASSVISMTYIAFVLRAMGTDFYPRLSGLIHDSGEARRALNEQTEVALLLAGPALIAMVALSPWVINLLYSPSFFPATGVLRWQILGDLLKVASWPLGFLLLAAGDGRHYVITEVTGAVVFSGLTVVLVPWIGLTGAGVAYAGMYLVYLPMVFARARYTFNYSWSVPVGRQFAFLVAALTSILAISLFASANLAIVLGLLLASATAVNSVRRLAHLGGSAVNMTSFASVWRRLKRTQ